MTTCEACGYQFTNIFMRRSCGKCGSLLVDPRRQTSYTARSTPAAKTEDDGFDSAGFAIGMMTGVPLSPTHGFSTGALLGSMLHSNPSHSAPASDPAPAPSPPCDTSSSYSSSSSSDSSSCSSSSSYDSGSSSSGGGDSGSW